MLAGVQEISIPLLQSGRRRSVFFFLLIVLVLITSHPGSSSQLKDRLRAQNENILFSIKLVDGQVVSICVNEQEKYLTCRLGTLSDLKLRIYVRPEEYGETFRYDYYFRGGGPHNIGLDLNSLIFEKDGYTLTVYDNYSAIDDVATAGIVIELSSGTKTYSTGLYGTKIGSLTTLRYPRRLGLQW